MKLCVMSTVLLFCLAIASYSQASNLVTNGDFSDSLDGWMVVNGTMPDRTCDVVDGVLGLRKSGAGQLGGGLVVAQRFSDQAENRNVRRVRLYIKCRIDGHSLPHSGTAAEESGGYGEYPLHIYLISGDDASLVPPLSNVIWNRGFLTQINTMALTNYDVVPVGREIVIDQMIDLEGFKLSGIVVESCGWDYETYIDEIRLESLD